MITKVKVRYLKQFESQEFDLRDHVILAGPNNSGKSTLLQAVTIWSLALRQWLEKRGPESGSKAKERIGVPVTRKDFTALPLREMNLLWKDTLTGLKKDELKAGQKLGQPRVLSITLDGDGTEGPWSSTFEFRYNTTEQVTIKPAPRSGDPVPLQARNLSIVHVPPFSGIGAEETGYDRPYQDLLIGQGKAGELLRNLVLEVFRNSKKDKSNTGWADLCETIRDIFGYSLLEPQYEGRPYILCEYLPGVPRRDHGRDGLATLDIACAGSGFLQVLLLLAFFYARPSTVLLLDEPDAHLHVVLQKQIHDRLRAIAAARGCQLLIATHSEVLIDGTSADKILSFYGEPHLLEEDTERAQVREAIKRLPASDLLLAENARGILYVEDEASFNILRAWAQLLNHRLYSKCLAHSPFWHNNHGRNPAEAKGHFFALRALQRDIKGYLLLDGDNRRFSDRELAADDLQIERWVRYEIENYLVHPEALLRFLRNRNVGPLFEAAARKYLEDEVPRAAYRDPLGAHDYLLSTPASKTLLPGFFAASLLPLRKPEYYMIAEQMQVEEIHPEVIRKLDAIADIFGVR